MSNGPYRGDQQELIDEARSYGDEDSARECEDFFRGWNAADNEDD